MMIISFLFLAYGICCSANSQFSMGTYVIVRIRGGSSPLEPNPNYSRHFSTNQETLGELEQRDPYLRQWNNNHNNHNKQQQGSYNYHPLATQSSSSSKEPLGLGKVIMDFFVKMKRISPTLFYGTVSSIVVFLMWQFPIFSTFLQRHFICSRNNILYKKRIHTLLLSAISHASFRHLFLNLYAFYTFGSSVKTILASNHHTASWKLWHFCLGAAIVSNIVFLLSSQHGSCIGLSGVALALLALYAKVYPSSQLGFIVHFIPIRLPAQYVLTGLFLISIFGLLTKNAGNNNIAHATHLGGLLFGVLFYELTNRPYFQKYFQPRHKRF